MAGKKFAVRVGVQGQASKVVMIGSGGTVRTALLAAKLDPEKMGGAITVNGEAAGLADRLKAADYLAVTPKVEGGR